MAFAISQELLFIAFVLAAFCFIGMAWLYRRGYVRMGELQSCIAGLRKELRGARKELADANVGRQKLQKSIDRLIIRRDELLQCLSVARDDKEKVACIMRLMGEDDDNEHYG